jgi:hypothetical protein
VFKAEGRFVYRIASPVAGGRRGRMGALIFIYFLFVLAVYIFVAYCLMRIAQDESEEPAWFAWVPFLNLWLITKLAQKDVVWFILCFIPFVNIVIIIIMWMAIAERLGYESWWGILMIVPFLNFYVIWRFAFGQP